MDPQTKEEKRAVGRRNLIKWVAFAGAALGLPRWKVFEVLHLAGGHALADAAACAPTNRSVHVVAGDGGFAWYQLIWPHNDIAAARDPSFAFHAPGEERMAEGTHRPLTLGPEAPWAGLPGGRQVTAMMAGNNQTHSRQPDASSTIAMGTSVFAACAALQASNPTLVPVIVIDDAPYGSAQGAPRAARVGSANEIVSLFNSAASRAGGALSNARDAELFSSSYSAFVGLHRAAGIPTARSGFQAGTQAARLLGRNLADQLRVRDEDLVRYGIDASSPNKTMEFARALIVTAKAFRLGLTSSVIVPHFRDDPHNAFNDMATLRRTVDETGRSYDAFLADLAVDDPTCGGSTIADHTVISIHGDTPKNPRQADGWPDGTPNDANWCYVLGAGHLKSGWFGGVLRNGDVNGWNPTTGAEVSGMSSAATATAAAAAIAYAVARGDMRRVNDFYRGTDIRGVIQSATT